MSQSLIKIRYEYLVDTNGMCDKLVKLHLSVIFNSFCYSKQNWCFPPTIITDTCAYTERVRGQADLEEDLIKACLIKLFYNGNSYKPQKDWIAFKL